MSSTALVWFTNDLRCMDQHSLQKAIHAHTTVYGIFCFDPKNFTQTQFGFKKTAQYRAQFLIETVTELRKNLAQLHIPLFVYHQAPEIAVPQCIARHAIDTVYVQKEWTAEEVSTFRNTVKNTSSHAIHWVTTYDQFLFHPEDLPFDITNIPSVFTDFRKQCEKNIQVRTLVAPIPVEQQYPIKNTTLIPTLEELGFTEAYVMDARTAFPFKGGEDQAKKRIDHYFWETKKLSYYKKTRNGLVGTDYSSKLSAWLANGAISPRMIYHEVLQYENNIGKNQSTYWLIFELIWRDFFKYVSMQHGTAIFKKSGIRKVHYDWENDPKRISQWIHGKTSEPFVNANMIELKTTGWMSNRGRQNVASFFAKSQQLDWRIGAAYFESMLIDYDVHSNYGNWNYVAGVGNDPRDRKFNIQLQAQRYDPKQKFQSMWLQPTLF